ncbi:MAG: xylulokinase [bacterium]|nr:xylulokinase [bacterium]
MKEKLYTIGIDSGTQSTKAVLMDIGTGRVCASASATYRLYEGPDGSREQDPQDWVRAVRTSVCAVVRAGRVKPEQVLGIGVSGQQHGLVALDKEGRVIRRAKLWNDSSTAAQCEYLINRLGGVKKTIGTIGNTIPPGFTASKIRWLKEREPENYARLALILLPHNYINYWLTGVAVMEPGDASGTAFYDVVHRRWSEAALRAIDEERDLRECLPPLQESHEVVGKVRAEVAKELGLSRDCIVATGGGDNMMSAIGTGNVRPGVVTASLGTSGTIFAYAERPVIDRRAGEIAAFCSSTGGWLPLLCVMNCTVSTEVVKQAFGLTTEELTRLAGRVGVGAEGVLLLPYFTGERTPNVPHGRGVWYGLTVQNFTAGHMARAAMEGAVLGMNYGLERMRELGVKPTQIRLTGGGAKNPLWRQICADVFNVECVTMQIEEAAALGGAIQALWAYECQREGFRPITALTDRLVQMGRGRHTPDAENAKKYSVLYARQCSLSKQMRPIFEEHAQSVQRGEGV